MSCAPQAGVPAWALYFFDATVKHIRKTPKRKPGVWKLKPNELEHLTPKDLDQHLKGVSTKELKRWARSYLNSKLTAHLQREPADDTVLRLFILEVATYKRGATSRVTQSKIRHDFKTRTSSHYDPQNNILTKTQRALDLTRNALDHRNEEEFIQTIVTDACARLITDPDKRI